MGVAGVSPGSGARSGSGSRLATAAPCGDAGGLSAGSSAAPAGIVFCNNLSGRSQRRGALGGFARPVRPPHELQRKH